MVLPSGTQRIEAISTPLQHAYGQTISLDEVPSEWLPSAIATHMKVTHQGEQVGEAAIGRSHIVSEPLMLDRPADVQLWMQSSSAWRVSEDVRQPDEDVSMQDEVEGDDGEEQ